MEHLLHLDQSLFLYLNNLGDPTWDGFWKVVTYKWTWLPFYAFLIYMLYRHIRIKATLVTLILIALMITFTDQITHFFKHYTLRLRPCNEDISGRFLMDHCGSYGFFSGHATSSMALAIFVGGVLKPYYRYAIFGMIIWSLFVGYSRIYVGKHYPGDVLTGWVFGCIVGYLFLKAQRLFIRRYLAKIPRIYLFSSK